MIESKAFCGCEWENVTREVVVDLSLRDIEETESNDLTGPVIGHLLKG